MPFKKDVSKIVVVAPAAASAGSAVLPFVVAGVGLFLAFKFLPSLGDAAAAAAKKAAGAAAEGTGDFLTGAFTGGGRTEEPITKALVGDTVYQLTPGTTLGTFDTWDPKETTRYVVQYGEDGLPFVSIENPSAILPPPTFYTTEQAPLAQRVGAAVIYDPVTGLFTDPFLGDFGGPSIQDAATYLVEGDLLGDTIGGVVTGVKKLWGLIT